MTFAEIVNHVGAVGDHDKERAFDLLAKFIEGKWPLGDLCMALRMQVLYAEASRREENGLNGLVAEDVFELCFTYALDILAEWREAVTRLYASGNAIPPMCAIMQGEIAMIDRDFDRATDRAAALRKVPGYDPRHTAARFTGEFFRDIETVACEWEHAVPRVGFPIPSDRRRVLVCCDQKYWDEYGAHLETSFIASRTNADFHIHVYNPDPGCPLDSSEAAPPGADRVYYATARFVRMWQLCELDPIPTIMIDADMFINRPLDDLFAKLETCDAVLMRLAGRTSFNSQIAAGVVGINSTPMGLRYLRRVAGYILKLYGTGETIPWGLDQIALNCTLWNMKTEDLHVNALAMGRTVYDGTFDDHLMIWPQKVGEKSPYRDRWEAACQRFGKGVLNDARP